MTHRKLSACLAHVTAGGAAGLFGLGQSQWSLTDEAVWLEQRDTVEAQSQRLDGLSNWEGIPVGHVYMRELSSETHVCLRGNFEYQPVPPKRNSCTTSTLNIAS